MKFIKKNLRLIIGIILLIVGIGFMIIPFIPIGYIFIFVAAIFLATYIPPLNRLLDYMKKKDKKGRLDKVEDKVEDFEERFDDKEDKNDTQDERNEKKSKPSEPRIRVEKKVKDRDKDKSENK